VISRFGLSFITSGSDFEIRKSSTWSMRHIITISKVKYVKKNMNSEAKAHAVIALACFS
jgi:hypothetical protein